MNERRQDFECLRQFARQGDQSAFAALVRRHLDLVYATALRKVEDEDAAEEIAQNVFAALARKAWRFAPDDSLPAWLYRTALLESKQWLRGELRRRRREQTAAELGTTMKTSDEQSTFRALLPLLDEALLSLREKDRTALLLRYYEGQPLRELGATLGVSEDAAQKRVTGALEKLMEFFQRRGFRTATLAVTAAALQHTAKAAPAVVLATVVNSALQFAPPALSGAAAAGAYLMSLTKVQKAMFCLVLLMLPAIWRWNATRAAQKEAAQQQAALAARVETQRFQASEAQTARDHAVARFYETRPESLENRWPLGEYDVHLRAIVALPDFKVALLKIHHDSLDHGRSSPFVLHKILAERDTFEDRSVKGAYVRFEMSSVDSQNWNIKLKEDEQEKVYELEESRGNPSAPDIVATGYLPNVELTDFVDLYALLTDRTVLCHPQSKSQILFGGYVLTATNKLEAAKSFEKMFRREGIQIIFHGEKFALLLPIQLADSVAAALGKSPDSTPDSADSVPPGAIHLQNVSLTEVLPIYAALTDRKPIQADRVQGVISFRTQTALTKAEVIYALDILIGWQGLKVTLVGEKYFKVVRRNG